MLFGIDKVAKYHVDAKMNAWFGVVAVNQAKYDTLSANQRTALDANCNTDAAVRLASGWADFEVAGRNKVVGVSGQHVTTLTPEQLAAWRKAAAPLTAAWEDSVRKTGVDPEKAMAALNASLKQNGRRILSGGGRAGVCQCRKRS